jgi:hypothetical protein
MKLLSSLEWHRRLLHYQHHHDCHLLYSLFISIIYIYAVISSSPLSEKFAHADKKAQLVTYLTAGYPHPDETVDLLLAMQNGGADILELGVPFTDPQADGATIQKANEVALEHGNDDDDIDNDNKHYVYLFT